jgi:WD40 repeat protein
MTIKKIVFAILLSIISIGEVTSQVIEFDSVRKIDIPGNRGYFFPVLSPDGDKIALTSSNQSGLWLYDIKSGTLEVISKEAGAGKDVVFSPDGSVVFYSEDFYVNHRRQSVLMSYELLESVSQPVVSSSVVDAFLWGKSENTKRGFLRKGSHAFRGLNIEALLHGFWDSPFAYSHGGKLFLKTFKQKKELTPVGGSRYIWGSLSPDHRKVLGYAIGQGSFVCDLEGKIIHQMQEVEGPVWVSDGVILANEISDDGHVLRGVKTWAINVNTGKKQVCTGLMNGIMYPHVLNSEKLICGHLSDGGIVIARFRD